MGRGSGLAPRSTGDSGSQQVWASRPLRPPRVGALRYGLLAAALAVALGGPATGFAEDPAPAAALDWETGARKSYLIPAL
jgi:hypothetical protein